MKKLARLAGLLSLAIFAVGLMSSSSASATGYLLLPVGAVILALGLPAVLSSGGDTVSCSSDRFTATVASVHLIGPFVVHFLGCTSSSDEGAVNCAIKSTNTTNEGLILTNTLHALIGLGLPGDLPALLVLPATGKRFATLAANSCTPETTVAGDVAGLLSQTVGKLTSKALLCFEPGDPGKIDLPLGGTVTPEIEAFGVEAAFETQVSLLYDTSVELMP